MAASITYDAELMTNYVPAVSVAGGSHFAACLDPVTRRPVIVGLSNDEVPKLQAIKESQDGVRRIVDLGALLNIPAASIIQAFDIQQAPDLSLFMVVATKASEKTSNVIVVRNFKLTDDLSLRVYPIQEVGQVFAIYIAAPGSNAGDSNYPMVALMNQPLGRSARGTDITRLNIGQNSWTKMKDLELPENAEEVLGIAPASSIFGKGIFVLYNISGQRAILGEFAQPLRHAQDGSLNYFSASLTCPAGATSIASYVDQDGYSALVVACDNGIQLFGSSVATTKDAPGVLISSAPELRNLVRVSLAQDGNQLAVWGNNASEQLVYLTSTTATLATGRDKAYILLPMGKSNDFASTISMPDPKLGQSEVCQTLLSKDDAGNFTILQQSRITGIWKTEPFYIYNESKNIKVASYTITIKAFAASGKPLINGSVFIKASSSSNVVANGKCVTIGSAPTWTSLDNAGDLHLIVAADGLAGRTFEITGVRLDKGSNLSFSPLVIEPNRKAIEALGAIKNGSDLANAKTKSGESLWEAGQKPSDEDLDNAAKCFSTMHTAFSELPANGSIAKAANSAARNIIAVERSVQSDVGELFMDGWNWIKNKVHEATDWIVQKVGDVWQFVCSVAGEVKKFVLDCVEKIAEAATWVWNKIKLGLQKLIDFLGFLFNWGDIVATKNTISSFLTAGIEFGVMKIDGLEQKVDDFFSNLQNKVQHLKVLPKDVSSDNAKQTSGSGSDVQNSTGFNWASERLKNGGAQNASIKDNAPVTGKGEKSFSDILEPIGTAFLNTVTQLGKDISALFDQNQNMSAGDLLKNLGVDLLNNILEVCKKVVISLLDSVKWLLEALSKLGNYAINIPIISPLYREISGHDLTLFDALSLIIAIPTTVLIKAITDAAPPTFPGQQINGKFLSDLVASPSPLPDSVKTDFAILTSGTIVSIAVMKGLYNLIRAAVAGVSKGSAGAVEFMTPSKAANVFGLGIDLLASVLTMPSDPSLPGYDLRQAASYANFFRVGCNMIYIFAPLDEGVKEKAEKIVLVVDLLTALVSFGLMSTVYVQEVEDANWKEKDDDMSTLSTGTEAFNCLAGVGAFVLGFFGLPEAEVAAIGAAVMVVCGGGKAAVDGVKFGQEYKKAKNPRLTAPSF